MKYATVPRYTACDVLTRTPDRVTEGERAARAVKPDVTANILLACQERQVTEEGRNDLNAQL